jgi:hypothetical protein
MIIATTHPCSPRRGDLTGVVPPLLSGWLWHTTERVGVIAPAPVHGGWSRSGRVATSSGSQRVSPGGTPLVIVVASQPGAMNRAPYQLQPR